MPTAWIRGLQRTLSVVVVTYSAVALAVALPRLCEQLGAGDQLVVVDNASSDDTVEVVRDVAPGAEIVRTERNTGFAVRGSVGDARARRRWTCPPRRRRRGRSLPFHGSGPLA
jgi:glycosyltransferase involved in cell wall biosynthesis